MKTPMKKAVYAGTAISGMIVFGMVFDLLTTPPTTKAMQLESQQFLLDSQKDTPDLPFTQDGCSLFPDRMLWHDFTSACFSHDLKYWAGGSVAERKAADVALKDEIAHTGPLGSIFSPLMYIGVRLFGDSVITKAVGAHWGYGWEE